MLNFFPLLAVPVVLYNIIALGGGVLSRSSTDVVAGLAATVFTLPMASGQNWTITAGDVLIFVALVMLFAELIKVARNGRDAALNHTLSLALFILCLIEFLLIPAFASSLFFIITAMALMDVIAGYLMTAPLVDERDEQIDEYED